MGPVKLNKSNNVKIGNDKLEWCTEFKYLGINFKSGKSLSVDLTECRRKFFSAANRILAKTKFCNEMVKLYLIENYCLPLLTYAIESLPIKDKQLKEINSWWNSIYRILFNYNKWESVSELIFYLGRLNFKRTYILQHILFVKNSMERCLNPKFNKIVTNYAKESKCISILQRNFISIEWNVNKIKNIMYQNFKDKVVKQSIIM